MAEHAVRDLVEYIRARLVRVRLRTKTKAKYGFQAVFLVILEISRQVKISSWLLITDCF